MNELNEKIKQHYTKIRVLMKDHNFLVERRNLEFFFRAHFKIPFKKIVKNIREVVKIMID